MAKFKQLPPLEELQKILSYDPETGVFTWLASTGTQGAGQIAGCIHSKGYLAIRFKKRLLYAHRLAWLFGTGEDPGASTVDHINRRKDDNRIQNLRLATPQQQSTNQPMQVNNTSGFKGVYFHKQANKWHARITSGGKLESLGLYATKEEAAAVYQKAATACFGEFVGELT